MNSSIKFIHHKLNKKDKLGYIYLQHIQNRTKSYRSLRLPKIHEKYWDESIQRVRKTKDVEYEIYNSKIEETYKELLIGDKDILTIDGIKTRKSFLSYFENVVEEKLKNDHGTRLKYRTVLNKLKDYVKSQNRTDLSFSEMDLDYIEDLNVYLKSTGLETNTVIHYLKVIRVIIRKSQKRKEYINVKDPFVNYKFDHKQKKTKETLTKEEILIIKNLIIEDDKLDRVRNLFMFQFMTNGLRVSDLTTLRYNNFSNGRIDYVMFKTNNPINIPILDVHIEILKKLINLKTDLKTITLDDQKSDRQRLDELKRNHNKVTTRPRRPSPINLSPTKFKDPIIVMTNPVVVYTNNYYDEYLMILNSMTLDELIDEYELVLEFEENKGQMKIQKSMYRDLSQSYERLKDQLEQYIKYLEISIIKLKEKYFKRVIEEIHELSINKKTRNSFIFGMLKDEDFSNVDGKNNFSLIDFSQYQKIHKSGVLYNRHLKELQTKTGLKKSLRTHLPRISFTNIMMGMEGVNHNDISKKLGHSSISITDQYLNTGFNSDRGDTVQRKFEDEMK